MGVLLHPHRGVEPDPMPTVSSRRNACSSALAPDAAPTDSTVTPTAEASDSAALSNRALEPLPDPLKNPPSWGTERVGNVRPRHGEAAQIILVRSFPESVREKM